MGFVQVRIALENLARPGTRRDLDALVDTGALYSLIPADTLRGIGIEPRERQTFELASGDAIERGAGEARFFFDGRSAASPVIFGEEGESPLLGVVTLESMGLEVVPVRRQVRPTRMILY